MYSCGIFANTGNYRGMGDVKFVPNLNENNFETIVNVSKANQIDGVIVQKLWHKCKGPIFNLTDGTKNLGFYGQGVTTYFSDNCNQDDSTLVNEWLKSKKVEGYIARTFKEIDVDGHASYDIKIASVATGPKAGITLEPEQYKGSTFKITRGDFSRWLTLVNQSLECAVEHAANENEINAIKEYVKSFSEGDLEAHKDATR